MFSVNYQIKLELYTKLVDYFVVHSKTITATRLDSLETPKNKSVVAQKWR